MRKAYLVTFATVLMFLLLFMTISTYSNWNQKIEKDATRIKSLDKPPFVIDDISFSMIKIIQTDMNMRSTQGTLTVKFKDFIPAIGNMTESLMAYESMMEGEYAKNANVNISINQSSLLDSPRIEFSNGLVYEYADSQKNGIFLHGGDSYPHEVIIRIRANKEFNTTAENWTWDPNGDIKVILDIRDSNGSPIPIGTLTEGNVSSFSENNASILFQKEGNTYPELKIHIGQIGAYNGSVKIDKVRLVNFESELTVEMVNYGQVRAFLPASVEVSDEQAGMQGVVLLGQI
jgi:hypothetical protein